VLTRPYRVLFLGVLLAPVLACVDSGESPAGADEPPHERTQERPPPQEPRPIEDEPKAIAPRLPDPGGPLAPAQTRIADGVRGDELADVATCERCHADVVEQWRGSAHAWASFNNPIYRASIERYQEQLGRERSRFCAGCHDPALLVDGAIDLPVAAEDPRAHAGVTCMTCHGIDTALPDGNGSYHLARSTPHLPNVDDPTSIARHRRDVTSPALRSGEACGSCHRSFLNEATGHPAHIAGADDLGPWQTSAYAGHARRVDRAVPAQDCVDCHMPPEPAHRDAAATAGKITSHRFLGGHTWLAAIRDDAATQAAVADFLRDTVSIDVAAIRHGDRYTMPADAAAVLPDERIEAEVVLRNLGVGHHFPGGTRDAHGTDVEVEVRGADGVLVAYTQTPHPLRAGIVDEDGALRRAREIEAFRVIAYDHTIAPRDAIVVRFAAQLPQDLPTERWPLHLNARLVHRSRSVELAARTCEAAETPSGEAFARAAERFTGRRPDGCTLPPATLLAEATVELGVGATDRSDRPTWERLYELGLGLQHEVQERQDRSILAYTAALEHSLDDPEARVLILAGLAEVAAHQGRRDDALDLADQLADRLSILAGSTGSAGSTEGPDATTQVAVDILRGRALAAVWQWSAALDPLLRVVDAFPQDPSAQSDLALAMGSAAQPERALIAALRGLAHRPRDPDLLRLQALALRNVGHPDAAIALDAYLAHRPPDFGPALRNACSRDSRSCALERLPVHTHELTIADEAH